MTIYFHVDRGAQLCQGQRINLQKLEFPTSPDLDLHCNSQLLNNVSFHGKQYLNSQVKAGNGEAAIELIWEYVRRAHFPNKPSRYGATFAWRTKEEAEAFLEIAGPNIAKIWRIDAAESFIANMSLLNIGTSAIRASQFAHAYWEGSVGPVINGLQKPAWEVLLTGNLTVIDQA